MHVVAVAHQSLLGNCMWIAESSPLLYYALILLDGEIMLTYEPSYHCLGCRNYDVCASCADIGLYCLDDSHSWIMREIINGQLSDIGSRVRAEAARNVSTEAKKYPSKFRPPQTTADPITLFAEEHRFIRRSDSREILIYTSGNCLDDSQKNPKGGCAVIFRPAAYTERGILTHAEGFMFPLESKGPTGESHTATSLRAELRAVVAALQFYDWSVDCNRSWRSLVIATDSEYVAANAPEHVQQWEARKWKLPLPPTGPQEAVFVKNQDLWKLLLKEVRSLQGRGLNVAFWLISKEMNARADAMAKNMAKLDSPPEFSVTIPAGSKATKRVPYQHHDAA